MAKLRNKEVILIVAARPNFMKAAAVCRGLKKYGDISLNLIHTKQHYDKNLSAVFFEDLSIPQPNISLDVGSGTHAQQTAKTMIELEKVLLETDGSNKNRILVVVGDVNSTLAAALVGAKLQIPIAHVEAGLRSNNKQMPEEINRLATDAITDLFLCSEPSAVKNLNREGVQPNKVHFVGNTMIDSMLHLLEKSKSRTILKDLGLKKKAYCVVTLHRPSNVDGKEQLSKLVSTLKMVSTKSRVVFAVHPRTLKKLREFGQLQSLESADITLLEPQGYLDFLALTSQAEFVITDSGGLQEETTALKVPCLTMRKETERPITVTEGSNVLVGSDTKLLERCIEEVKSKKFNVGKCPKYWDNDVGNRIAALLNAAFDELA